MIAIMDKLFVSIGLDGKEIEESTIRGWLYFGMIFMAGFAAACWLMVAIG